MTWIVAIVLLQAEFEAYEYGTRAWYAREAAEAAERQADAIEDNTRAIEDLGWEVRRDSRGYYPSGPQYQTAPRLPRLTPLHESRPSSENPSWVTPLVAGAVGAGAVVGAYFLLQRPNKT